MDYEADFYAWTQAQAAALRRAGDARVNVPAQIDWTHVAEELESMGASEQREIVSRLTVLLEHLLKLALVPLVEPRNGWRNTVREQRDQILAVIEQSPSLRGHVEAVQARTYARACQRFRDGYDGPVPAACPFDLWHEALAEEWFPERRG